MMTTLCNNPGLTMLLGSRRGMDSFLSQMSTDVNSSSSSKLATSGNNNSSEIMMNTSAHQNPPTATASNPSSLLTLHTTSTAVTSDSSTHTHTFDTLPSSSRGNDDNTLKLPTMESSKSENDGIVASGSSPSGLKLAQYTLEDMPENQSQAFPQDSTPSLSSPLHSNLPPSAEVGVVNEMGRVSGDGAMSGAPTVVKATDKQAESRFSSQSDENVAMTMTPCNTGESDTETGPCGMGMGQEGSSNNRKTSSTACDFLGPLFSNWPGIVTTILGFYPLGPSEDGSSILKEGARSTTQLCDPPQSGSSQNKMMSSVQVLDSFTMHLILNCSEACIENFTSTIIFKINSCLAESSSIDLDTTVHDVDLSRIDEKSLPMLVGKRFLNSVIRVLAMEHSRVKNMFLEMQQLRDGRVSEGGGVRGGGGRERGRGGTGRGSERETGTSAPLKNAAKIAK